MITHLAEVSCEAFWDSENQLQIIQYHKRFMNPEKLHGKTIKSS